ncbi:MAG: gamma carbonic anhydrase family protein [Actinomycetota bacterium]|nr:gamma carbonic anhydrase family protein [Actinomycetota bacterium]
MAIYALGDLQPRIDPSAFIHPEAVIIGDVTIGPESSVWPCAVLRGDEGGITVGARTSVQDGCVIHTIPESPTTIGNECVIGHAVHLEGCIIEDHALVGSGAVVLHRAVVRSWGLVGANAVVPGGKEVPGHAMALGVPAKIRENTVNVDEITEGVEHYVKRVHQYREELRRLD